MPNITLHYITVHYITPPLNLYTWQSIKLTASRGMVRKMAIDVEAAICNIIVVSFLPCLVAFLTFHPYMLFHFFLVTCMYWVVHEK